MIDALLPDALGVCGLMPDAFMSLCPREFDIMREQKFKLLRISNPYLQAPEEPKKEQSQEEQMNMILLANTTMGGS